MNGGDYTTPRSNGGDLYNFRMRIELNGESKELNAALTLQELLDQLQIQSGRVACEVNLKIIKRAFYPETLLKDGDAVEIIQAIGGG
jgi:thiamine biosynthesis protein ThiS